MADAYNVSRTGQINQAGDVKAIFLKVFAGEVLTAFEGNNVIVDKQLVKSISSGKSAQFPVVGMIGSGYHTAGDELTGLDVNHAERVITIDDLLVSHAFVANIDEAMEHYDSRSIYSVEMGRKLAKDYDQAVMQEIILGARASALVTDGNGGTEITSDLFKNDGGTAGSATDAAAATAIAGGIFTAAQTLDENDAPSEGRFCAVKPKEYYMLAQNTDLINKDWSGAGAYSDGTILRIAGIQIVKTNNMPSTDLTGNSFHGVDATKTIAAVWVKEGVATVKLLELATEMDYQVERQGTLLVAKMAVGHGYLRPDCCIELKLNTLNN